MPMVVVLPTPLTPMTRMTAGSLEISSPVSSCIMPLRMSHRASRSSSRVLIRWCLARSRSSSTALEAVTAPRSARIMASSSSSSKSSSTLTKAAMTSPMDSLTASVVFFSPCLILSKNPIIESLLISTPCAFPVPHPQYSASTAWKHHAPAWSRHTACLLPP